MHDLQTEQSLLGLLMVNNKAMIELENLKPEHFFSVDNAAIFKIMVDNDQDGKSFGLIDIGNKFLGNQNMRDYLTDAVGAPPYTDKDTAVKYSQYMQELWKKRQLQELGQKLMDSSVKDSNSDEIMVEHEKRYFELSKLDEKKDHGTFKENYDKFYENTKIVRDQRKNNQSIGISTSFKALDETIGGFVNSNLYILAARPGMGKTALATDMGFNAAKKDISVGFFSLEMPTEQLITRIASKELKIPYAKIVKGETTVEDLSFIEDYKQKATSIKFYVDDDPSDILTLRKRALLMKKRYGIELLIIDYLGLIEGIEKKHSIYEKTTFITPF